MKLVNTTVGRRIALRGKKVRVRGDVSLNKA